MTTEEEIRVTNQITGGQKGQKVARYDLIPSEPLRTLARLYGKGANKYAERNWERGYDWSLSFAALQRHVWAFWDGEDIDEELGLPHLAAVVFHAFALLEFASTHPELDNRPKKSKVERAEVELDEHELLLRALVDLLYIGIDIRLLGVPPELVEEATLRQRDDLSYS